MENPLMEIKNKAKSNSVNNTKNLSTENIIFKPINTNLINTTTAY